MAGNIKGITIELDGNTQGLQKALSDVDKKSRDLQGELKQVERALKFNPGNIELLAQKQQLLSEQVQNTTTRLDRLKKAQQQVERQFESGKIGADQFRAFQREIIKTESQLKGLKTQLGKIDDVPAPKNLKTDLKQVGKEADEAKGAVSELGAVLGGLVAGEGISGAIETALDTSSLQTKIDLAFNVPNESKQGIKEVIQSIQAYGIDGSEALEVVRKQWALNKNATDEVNAAVVKGAAVISNAYAGLDFNELIQETNEISGALKISNQDALGLVNALLKAGFPPDQIDIISEYGTQLKTAGFNAEQIQAIFAAGIDTKTWNIDNLIDGIKEGRISLAAFGQAIPKSLKQLLQSADISTKQFDKWGDAVAKGGAGGQKAMGQVATAVNKVKDATLKNTLGVAIWGTQYEDQGQNILNTLTNASDKTVSLKSNQDQLNAAVKKMDSDPMTKWNQSVTDLKTALTPLLVLITDIISNISDWVAANPQLSATLVTIGTVIGVLVGFLLVLAPIFTALSAAAVALGIGLGALIGIVAAVIAVIALLVAAGIWLYENWDTVTAFLLEVWNEIVAAGITAFNWLGDVIASVMVWIGNAILVAWNSITSFLSASWEWIKSTAISLFNGLFDLIASVMISISSAIISAWNAIKNFLGSAWNWIKSTASSVFNGIKSFLASTWNSIKSAVSNTWSAVKSTISNAWSGIKSTISNGISSAYNTVTGYVSKFKTAGKSLLSALADGIKNGVGAAVTAVRNGMDNIRQYLPFSPAKVGPLSDLDKSGESFFPTFASKMNTGLKPMLAKVNAGFQDARNSIDANQIGTINGGNTVTNVNSTTNVPVNFTGPINIQNDQQIDEIAEKLSQAIARKTTIVNRAGGVRTYGT